MKQPEIKKMLIGATLYALVFFGNGKEVISGKDRDDRCGGIELWNIKTLTDPNADEIDESDTLLTIKQLIAIDTEVLRQKKQRLPFEKRIVKVKKVLIRKVILENDNDYHLVIQDRQGNHMVAEIVDPDCPDAQQSDYIDSYYNVRNTINRLGNKFMHYEFEITGTLFLDRAHGQTGMAANNIEIHPILSLKATKKLNY